MPTDRQFEFFDRFTPSYEDGRLSFALDDLRSLPPGTLDVIDVGCGNGSTLAYLAKGHPLASVTGLDPSTAYVDQASQVVEGTFAVGSVLDEETLAGHRRRYDRVVMASVLHHLVGRSRRSSKRNAEQAIRNCLSLLRDGGRLYLFEPLAGPRAFSALAFWLKSLGVRVFGNRRVELGARWVNVAAPLVSYLGHDEVVAMVEASGGRIIGLTVVTDKRMLRVLRWQRIGYTITRATPVGT